MYKISVPLNMKTINDETLPIYLNQIKMCGAERVFLCGMGNVYSDTSRLVRESDRIKKVIEFFRNKDLEVGIWISAFGHGHVISSELIFDKKSYCQITGIKGDNQKIHAHCPLDENFVNDYAEGVRKIAELHPDIIMLDDDFKINGRGGYYFGCFCENHIKRFYEIIGEELPREKLEELILTGGGNKYRSAYMKMTAESLLGFAKKLRKVVDEVDSEIRMGCCTAPEHFDFDGADPVKIAKAFAGKTKPFFRMAGAPYWKQGIIQVIENTRQQSQWSKDCGVERFAEGDVYPRPRYKVPSRLLEIFDLTLFADGGCDGILSYMFDYNQKPTYETGYLDRHIHNTKLRNDISRLFSCKSSVGVRVFNVEHKLENAVLPDEIPCERYIDNFIWLWDGMSTAVMILSENSIPVTYAENSEYPVLVFGENARYITAGEMKNGVIADVEAAKILQERGIDTGLISAQPAVFDGEYYIEHEDEILNIGKNGFYKIKCSDNAKVQSIFMPDESPASYIYENSDGTKFFVLAYAHYGAKHYEARENVNFTNNYYRQEQLVKNCGWLCEKKLPAVVTKNPMLYVLTSKNDTAMSVILVNAFADYITNAEIKLDREYTKAEFVNSKGYVKEDTVYISEIPAYGIAVFEVTI